MLFKLLRPFSRGIPRSVQYLSFNSLPSRRFSSSQQAPFDTLTLFRLLSAHWIPYSFNAILKLNIPQILKEKGPLPLSKLAKESGTDEDALFRVLRSLQSIGFFHETDGKWENNVNSTNLIPLYPMIHHQVRQLGSTWMYLEDTIKSGQSSYEKQTGITLWEYFKKNPTEEKIFNDAMVHMTSFFNPIITKEYRWEQYNGKKILDVGGGFGALLSGILTEKCTNSSGNIFDLPTVEKLAKQYIESKNLTKRLTFTPGSFFDDDTIPDADLVLLKHVLHDWNDEKCREILTQVRKSLLKKKSPGKLLVIEFVLPEKGIDQTTAFMDLLMLLVNDGKERTKKQWNMLFKESGFTLTNETLLPSIGLSVMETNVA